MSVTPRNQHSNIPYHVIIPFVGGRVTDDGHFDGAVSVTAGDHYTSVTSDGKTPQELRRDINHRNPTRIDFKSSDLRPLIIDFEYLSSAPRLDGCTCTDGTCDTCFSKVDIVSQAFAIQLATLFDATPVRFFSGGRGFHLYTLTRVAWTQQAVTATIRFLIRVVSSQMKDKHVQYCVDIAASSPTHAIRLPLSARPGGNIVCLAGEGFSRDRAPTVESITQEEIDDTARVMRRALYEREHPFSLK